MAVFSTASDAACPRNMRAARARGEGGLSLRRPDCDKGRFHVYALVRGEWICDTGGFTPDGEARPGLPLNCPVDEDHNPVGDSAETWAAALRADGFQVCIRPA